MSETKFRHTTARVPRLYKEAGKIVQKVREEGGSFKGLVFQSKQRSLLKSLYALVAETLRHGSELDALLRKTQILVKEPRLDPWLTRVLITELVWRQRPLSGPAVPLKIVQSYKSQFLSEQNDLPSRVTASRASRPRFVRINTLKSSEDEVINFFIQEGWYLQTVEDVGTPDEKYSNFLQRISSLSEREFFKDIHIPNLLVFPGNMEFYNSELYHNGSILLQDKASCMSAFLLNAPHGSTVLDMCAAPGMKTTHIAATLNNIGTVYAIEKHQARFNSLCQIVNQAGASCVKPICGSSLDFTHKELQDVEYIIVDPTCSGTGMINRKELFSDTDDVSKARLEKLAGFQCAILRHAMQNFPKVKRIVYSTCSLCPEENEAVVEEVLKSTPNFKAIVPSNGIQWMKRGDNSYEQGDFGLYARPEIDMTNGFFVVVFERTENEYVLKETIDLTQGKIGTEDLKKKKKKKDRKTPDGETVSAPEAVNPAFERMKRAMGNFNSTIENGSSSEVNGDYNEVPMSRKKSKKSKVVEELEQTLESNEDSVPLEESCTEKKKKRKSHNNEESKNMADNINENGDAESISKKKKKKKKSKELLEDADGDNISAQNYSESSSVENLPKKKKKKSSE